MVIDRRHLVVSESEHGVSRHSLALSRAVGERTLTLDPFRPEIALDAVANFATAKNARAHVGFTDKLWGRSPTVAADLISAICLRLPTTVTFHDVPQPSDGSVFSERIASYRRVIESAEAVAVNSDHERDLLIENRIFGAQSKLSQDDGAVTVIPLPLEADVEPGVYAPLTGSREQDAHTRPLMNALPNSVVVLGFLYPGKGHETIISAMAEAGLSGKWDFLAAGATSLGHEDLAQHLSDFAAEHGIAFSHTRFLDDASYRMIVRNAGIPVAAHRHISASGSIADWLAEGRCPLVADNRYTREVCQRWPHSVARVPENMWANTLKTVAESPVHAARTGNHAVPRWTWRDVAKTYQRWWLE